MRRACLHLLGAVLLCVCIAPLAGCASGSARGAVAAPMSSTADAPGGTAGGALLMSDDFSHPNGPNRLIVNEWSHWNPNDPARVLSAAWELTSGSLFSVDGTGWTGFPDDTAPDRYSEQHTDSQVFRMNTARGSFGDVLQQLDARINGFSGSAAFPPLNWDGVVLWPRYVNQFHLYFAYLLRKDGRVAITKKCPGQLAGGNFYNGGTYFDLDSGRYLGPTILGRWYRLASSVQDNPDGSVTIRTFQDGRLAARATDRGLGCPPIRARTHLGIRADNVDANFTRYRANALSALLASSCPDSVVGAKRRIELARMHRSGARAHVGRCPAAFAPATGSSHTPTARPG